MTAQRFYMAVSQYGDTFHGLTHPRKDLLARLGRQHAAKMYRDNADPAKPPRHCGYVIAGLWLEVFEVNRWHAPA
jgi:hypothetical protein